ncbi:MAG TPA: hypothetical protein G4O02_15000 [Caldilineae bacterium]|nr:hypothetical protein [Caldilineae bacterium]
MEEDFPFLLDPDVLLGYVTDRWRKEQEERPIYIHSKLSAALNKSPAQWVNAACQTLGLDTRALRNRKAKTQALVAHLTDPEKLKAVVHGLSPEAREALRMVIEAGGWMRVGPLYRRFGDCEGDGWFWEEEPPESVLGELRTRALLFIGKAPVGSRSYHVAVVPKELRPLLAEILAEIPPAPEPPELTRDVALANVLERIRQYYEEHIDWEPLIGRETIEAFIRHLAQKGEKPEKILQAWEDLWPFVIYMDHDVDEHPTLDDIKPYHLSEWVHLFIPRKFIVDWKLADLRRMLRTVAHFYAFLAEEGRGVSKATAERVAEAVDTLVSPKRKLGVILRPPPKGGEPILEIHSPEHGVVQFTINDYWLAIVCYAEHGGDWQALREAAGKVVDGKAKQERIDFITSHEPDSLTTLFMHGVPEEGVIEAFDWFYERSLSTERAW